MRFRLLALVALAARFWVSPALAGPIEWCGGSAEATANRTPDLFYSSSQIRVVYATPADGPDNFTVDAPLVAGDIAAIDA